MVEAKYLIVGGFALAYHGAPRYTGHLDLYIEPTTENAEKIIRALEEFGFGSLNITTSDFTTPDQTIQLGHPPVRIDLLTSIEGVNWEPAWAGRVSDHYDDIPVCFIGRDEFVLNKRAIGRTKDIADLESLGE